MWWLYFWLEYRIESTWWSDWHLVFLFFAVLCKFSSRVRGCLFNELYFLLLVSSCPYLLITAFVLPFDGECIMLAKQRSLLEQGCVSIQPLFESMWIRLFWNNWIWDDRQKQRDGKALSRWFVLGFSWGETGINSNHFVETQYACMPCRNAVAAGCRNLKGYLDAQRAQEVRGAGWVW